MTARIHASLTIALLAGSASAFCPASSLSIAGGTRSASSLNAAAFAIDSEDDAMAVMLRARDCASSDSCSIDDAQEYLREVVHIQGSCAAGTLAGQTLCDDIAFASEVVSGLRAKIENGALSSRSYLNEKQADLRGLAVAASDGAAALNPATTAQSPKTAVLALALLSTAVVISSVNQGANGGQVLPFTAQELIWSVRDGYFPDLVSHFMHHGGLLVGDSAAAPVASLAPQEWWFAARDGYLGDAVAHVSRNGGLLIGDAPSPEDVAVPFTAQEWAVATRDGYLGNMMSHYWRNGGL